MKASTENVTAFMKRIKIIYSLIFASQGRKKFDAFFRNNEKEKYR